MGNLPGSGKQTEAQKGDPDFGGGLWSTFTGRGLVARLRKSAEDADVRLLGALREHYRKTGDANSLVDFLQHWARRAHEKQHACDAYIEAADAVLAAYGDHRRARALYEKALHKWPGHREALQRLQTLLERDGDHRRLLQWLEHVARHFSTLETKPDHLPGVHCKLAELLERHLRRPDLAVEHLWLALHLNPTLMPAILSGRRICLELQDLEGVNAFYELQIQACVSPKERFALWMDLARFRSEQLCDVSGSISALRRALSVCPNDVEAMFNLARSLYVRGQQSVGEARQQDHRRAAEVLCLMAQKAPRDEARDYLRQALQCAPGHEPARVMLARLDASALAALDAARCGAGEPSSSARPPLAPSAPVQPPSAPAGAEEREASSEQRRDAVSTARLHAVAPGAPRPAASGAPAKEPRPSLEVPQVAGTLDSEPRHPPEASEAGAADFVEADTVNAAMQSPALPPSVARVKRELAARRSAMRAYPLPESVLRVKQALMARRSVSSQRSEHIDGFEGEEASAQPVPAARVVSSEEVVPSDDRTELEVNVGATTEANFYVGFSGDPIEGGVFVPTHNLLPKGTLLRMLITFPGGYETHAYGKVRFVSHPVEESSETTAGMGVQFQALTAEGAGLLHRFTANRVPVFLEE